MTEQKKSGFDVLDLIGDIPDLFLFLIDEDLRLLWKFPSLPERDEEEILGTIRENIVEAFQEEDREGAGGEASVLIRTFDLKRDGEPPRKYLLTLKKRRGGGALDASYAALVQDVTACVGAPCTAVARPPLREAVPAQRVRKLLHEISNPLSVISGYTEYMLTAMPEGDERRSFLEEIFDNTLRLRNIIGGALEEGGTSLSETPPG